MVSPCGPLAAQPGCEYRGGRFAERGSVGDPVLIIELRSSLNSPANRRIVRKKKLVPRAPYPELVRSMRYMHPLAAIARSPASLLCP